VDYRAVVSHGDIHYFHPAQRPSVGRLAAGGGVESSAVKDDGRLALPGQMLDHAGRKVNTI